MLKSFYKDWVVIAILLGAVASFILISQIELFEHAYDFTRRYKDYDLHELFSLILILPIVIPILVIRSNQKLRASLRAKQKAEEEAQHIALHDPLTGLHNRRHFHAMVQELTGSDDPDQAAPNVTAFMIDLDRFKPINDLRGHEVGDRLLIEVGHRLQHLVGAQGDVIRLGGDEFVVVLVGAHDRAATDRMATIILEVINAGFDILSWRFYISCSIGIADWHPGLSSTDLLRHADQAMYQAKGNGRSGFARYNNALGSRLRDEALIRDDLRQALDDGHIVPHFQPIYDIETGQVRAFEVLSRWEHPEHGFVPPDRFIATAEDLGLIDQLSDQVLDQACAHLVRWPTDVGLSFNISPSQFNNDRLVTRIATILDKYDLPGTRLEIEITEHAVLADIDRARVMIGEMTKLGIRIAMDDFGTGTSSLSTLANLPFNKLTIDRQFISGVHLSPQNAKIVIGVLAMARSLGLDVTAEGIEQPGELEFLDSHKCGLGQGYFLSKPMTGQDAYRLLNNLALAALKDVG